MISRRELLVLTSASGLAAGAMQSPRTALPSATDRHVSTAYDRVVRADRPVAYFATANESIWYDVAGGRHATFPLGHGWTSIRTGERIPVFDGIRQYAQVADHGVFSVPPEGAVTVEAWLRPTVLDFPSQERSGYVHFLGKGEGAGSHEWACRMYSLHNEERRPNRVSGYAFNLAGGLGAGSFFQDRLRPMTWFHLVFIVSRVGRAGMPDGYTAIYRDGILRARDGLHHYGIRPRNGSAPLRLGTRDFASYYQGALGKLAIYDHALSAARIRGHYVASPLRATTTRHHSAQKL